jgi:hypothetical protein
MSRQDAFRPMADGLAKDSGEDAIGRPLQQLPSEAPADAVAHEEEFADARLAIRNDSQARIHNSRRASIVRA